MAAGALTGAASFSLLLLLTSCLPTRAYGIGSASTIAISHPTGTICGIAAAGPRAVVCTAANRTTFHICPDVSFNSVSGGRDYICGLRSDNHSSGLFCWKPRDADGSARRVFYSPRMLKRVSVGVNHVAASEESGEGIMFWRGGPGFPTRPVDGGYKCLTSGDRFSCAIKKDTGKVRCWGERGRDMEMMFQKEPMVNIFAGEGHTCGLNVDGLAICKGRNESGQLGRASSSLEPYEYSTFAAGRSHTCAIRNVNGTVVCWGGSRGSFFYNPAGKDVSFEVIIAGGDMTCGIRSHNLSVVCWVLAKSSSPTRTIIPHLPQILPGFCTDIRHCSCGVFPNSSRLCSGNGVICNSCLGSVEASQSSTPPPSSPLPPPTTTVSKLLGRGLVVFAIVGSIGALVGFSSCLLRGATTYTKEEPNSARPTMQGTSDEERRNHGGHSSRVKELSFGELEEATGHFCQENKIAGGSFGTVYRGKLRCGREVAIKRNEGTYTSRDKKAAFECEVTLLSRLHHKHVVGMVGFHREGDEMLLVYEYMENGSLYSHLHCEEERKDSDANVLRSWMMRIKILLDVSRGIDYLHNYAMPPIIHRDVKSSNILLDGKWVAKISDLGFSISDGGPWDPAADGSRHMVLGTVGYIDPEYHMLSKVTQKSDVYGFGVVVLEVLTGRTVVFREGGPDGGEHINVVDYAVKRIRTVGVMSILDATMPAPVPREVEALEQVARVAVHCVRTEGSDRPTMTDVVANLEYALALGGHCSGRATDRDSDGIFRFECR